MSNICWRKVNDEPFEYAIQQGMHGDEFVKLLDGTCLRRPISEIEVSAERERCAVIADKWDNGIQHDQASIAGKSIAAEIRDGLR